MESLADSVEGVADVGAAFEGFSANISSIATGLAEIDSSLGSGKKRLEIISTLEHLSTMSTQNAGATMSKANAGVQTIAAVTGGQNINNQINFGPMELVLEDGTKLRAYINKVRDKAGRT